MQRIGDEYTVVDPAGRACPYATVSIYTAASAHTVADLVGAYDADDPLPTPVTTVTNPVVTDAFGRWRIALPDGRYDFKITGANFPDYFLYNICVFDNTITYPSPALGTVTSVALSAPAEFAVTGSPVTGTGTLGLAYGTWVKNKLIIGPSTGADATPTLRVLGLPDMPSFGGAAATYGSGTKIPVIVVNAQGIATGYSEATAVPTFANVASKPTTMTGYGIIDGIKVLFTQKVQTAYINSTAETTIIGAGVGTLTIPANALLEGTIVRIKFQGFGSSIGAGTGRFKLKLGGTTVLDTDASTAAYLAASKMYVAECAFVVQTIGAVGTMVPYFSIRANTQAVPNAVYGLDTGVASTAVNIDTTGTLLIDLTYQSTVASANDHLYVNQLQVLLEA